jgi:hypothetical protein
MEPAKKNLKLIEPSAAPSNPQKTSTAPQLDANTHISKKEKKDLYEVTRRKPQDSGQPEGKLVNKEF